MDDREELYTQIRMLCSSVTEDSYDESIRQGYELLKKLYVLGMSKEQVYQFLLQYYNSFENDIANDYTADIMDFVIGWCNPRWSIW